MITFAQLVESVEHLSVDEMDELWAILRRKKEEDILKKSEEARKESEEGKTVVLSSPEEIKLFFEQLMKDED